MVKYLCTLFDCHSMEERFFVSIILPYKVQKNKMSSNVENIKENIINVYSFFL